MSAFLALQGSNFGLLAKFLLSFVAVSDFFRIFALANSRRADSHGMPERL
jgi:hypothetical protein